MSATMCSLVCCSLSLSVHVYKADALSIYSAIWENGVVCVNILYIEDSGNTTLPLRHCDHNK